MDELKACPFCGGTDIVIRGSQAAARQWPVIAYTVRCRDCGAKTEHTVVENLDDAMRMAAAEVWNRWTELMENLKLRPFAEEKQRNVKGVSE